MDGTLSWILGGLATLFVLAVAVAWWEHLVRQDERRSAFESPRPALRTAAVDIELDALAAAAPADRGDQPERRAAFDGAMARMARRSSDPRPGQAARQGWVDTAPMITPGASPRTSGEARYAETTPGV